MSAVPEKIRTALSRVGYSEKKMLEFGSSSLLVQDLGIYGDDFDELYEVLCELYGTRPLFPAEYIPSEFSWMGRLRGWNLLRPIHKTLASRPLSLEKLDLIMRGNSS